MTIEIEIEVWFINLTGALKVTANWNLRSGNPFVFHVLRKH